jgi:hypothetical protein
MQTTAMEQGCKMPAHSPATHHAMRVPMEMRSDDLGCVAVLLGAFDLARKTRIDTLVARGAADAGLPAAYADALPAALMN